jgi:Domain of unknown function (DUF4365)
MSAGAEPRKGVRSNRPVERGGIRAVTGIFEDANMLVQEIDGAIDIGKDLYVDIVDGDEATGELIAIQVKAGESYRDGHDYAIPASPSDVSLWRSSTIPIFGVVHDPSAGLHWINLSSWARAQPNPPPTKVRISQAWPLEARTLVDFIAEAREYLRASGPPSLIGLADDDPTTQRAAVYDAFALGRHDARALLLLRASLRYLRDPVPLGFAIHVLALCIGHGDTFYTPRNWISPNVAGRVRQSFTWSYEETCQILAAAESEEYVRGGLGQDAAVLACDGWAPDIEERLTEVVLKADLNAAWPALMLLVTGTHDDALVLFDRVVPRSRSLRSDPTAAELRTVLVEHGGLSMW